MATTAQSALLPTILTSVVTQLRTVTAINAAYVHIVATDDYKITCGEPRFLYIRYYGLDPYTDAGAGRRARPTTRRLRVYIYTRNNVDQFETDTIALLAAGNHESLELQVVDAMDNFWPRDTDGNIVTIEPLHPLDSSSGPPLRKAEDDIGIIRSHLDYEIKFLSQVNTPQP